MTFPRLAVLGASARGALAGGVSSVELGYYDSKDDRSGSDPFVRNSELRLLVGYEREVAREARVPVIENKPVARALYAEVEVGRMIPESLYQAVAEILAYVYRLKRA